MQRLRQALRDLSCWAHRGRSLAAIAASDLAGPLARRSSRQSVGGARIHAVYFSCAADLEYLRLSIQSLNATAQGFVGRIYVYEDRKDPLDAQQRVSLTQDSASPVVFRRTRAPMAWGGVTLLHNELRAFNELAAELDVGDVIMKVDSDILFTADWLFPAVLAAGADLVGQPVASIATHTRRSIADIQGGCYFLRAGALQQLKTRSLLRAALQVARTSRYALWNIPEDRTVSQWAHDANLKIGLKDFYFLDLTRLRRSSFSSEADIASCLEQPTPFAAIHFERCKEKMASCYRWLRSSEGRVAMAVHNSSDARIPDTVLVGATLKQSPYPIRIAQVRSRSNGVSDTFIGAHAERLAGVAAVFHSEGGFPASDDRKVARPGFLAVAHRRVAKALGRDWWTPRDQAWETALRSVRADVVLVEYGTIGILIVYACKRIKVPFVVHFHGYDASVTAVLERNASAYKRMFERASAVVAVSRVMEHRLLDLGCPRERLVYSPYGVDCERFKDADPSRARPHFLAVGRMVQKKGPHLTIAAFARALGECPDARLRMIGDGILLNVCRDLASAMGIGHAVEFLGAQSHDVVAAEMRQARAFVQHSITATDGDSEGTPVAVLEAGAIGLPVISTRHAGIPDVVIDGVTGLLADERDIEEMARHMVTLIRNPARAAELGRGAAAHVRRYYSMEKSIDRLARVLNAAASRQDMGPTRASIEAELPILA